LMLLLKRTYGGGSSSHCNPLIILLTTGLIWLRSARFLELHVLVLR
jgi:hypothetical protein